MRTPLLALLLAACGPLNINPPTQCEGHVWDDADGDSYHLPSLQVAVDNQSGYPLELSMWSDVLTVAAPRAGAFEIPMKRVNEPGNGWLGLARVWAEPSGRVHRAEVLMNEGYPHMADPAIAAHVGCMEVGHTLGLDHQDGALDSCMNDCQSAGNWTHCMTQPEAQTPNAHDLAQLREIYTGELPPPTPPACGVTLRVFVTTFPAN